MNKNQHPRYLYFTMIRSIFKVPTPMCPNRHTCTAWGRHHPQPLPHAALTLPSIFSNRMLAESSLLHLTCFPREPLKFPMDLLQPTPNVQTSECTVQLLAHAYLYQTSPKWTNLYKVSTSSQNLFLFRTPSILVVEERDPNILFH